MKQRKSFNFKQLLHFGEFDGDYIATPLRLHCELIRNGVATESPSISPKCESCINEEELKALNNLRQNQSQEYMKHSIYFRGVSTLYLTSIEKDLSIKSKHL